MPSNLITVRAHYSLEDKERYNIILVVEEKCICVLQQVVRSDLSSCYLILYMLVFPTTSYSKLLFHGRLQRQNLFIMAFKRVPGGNNHGSTV